MNNKPKRMNFFDTSPNPRSKRYLRLVEEGKGHFILEAVDAERAGRDQGEKSAIRIRRLGVKQAKR